MFSMFPHLSLSKCLLLCLGLYAYFLTIVQSAQYSPVLRNSRSNICPTPFFTNGIIRMRFRGKFLLFVCDKGYTLVGEKYMSCKNGRWATAPPICIKPGCSELPTQDKRIILYENGNATATVFCQSGYEVAGSLFSYCNGTHWDRSIGVCRQTKMAVETGCDFEVTGLCGWTNEASHGFGWKRSAGVNTRKDLKTGPKADHTTGVPLDGHFMIIDSSEQYTNATARIFSPIYPANYSIKACFQFFYHLYGDTVGKLVIYVKPITMQMDRMFKEGRHFSIGENQGNSWHPGYFDLKPQSEDFQVVIEASLGMRFKSDVAIDDVSLLQGDQCQSNSNVTDAYSTESYEESYPVYRIDSCENRCRLNTTLIIETQDIIHCDCLESCVESKTCCPDFMEICVFNVQAKEDDTAALFDNDSDPTSDSNQLSHSTVYLLSIGSILMVMGLAFIIVHSRKNSSVVFYIWIKNKITSGGDRNGHQMEDMRFLAVNEELEDRVTEECQTENVVKKQIACIAYQQ
ncbi:uncharacterized protein LOC129749037 [Uranotaenia lowii]|uniref:uncharacterized protein LOC129749037 n=1 Tax=Uranotaenia lowii TaxID=190385 RepID=UPI0024789674|nr:uncharacterized protein LOC129749037 [Uranotaenia lowii]